MLYSEELGAGIIREAVQTVFKNLGGLVWPSTYLVRCQALGMKPMEQRWEK